MRHVVVVRNSKTSSTTPFLMPALIKRWLMPLEESQKADIVHNIILASLESLPRQTQVEVLMRVKQTLRIEVVKIEGPKS